MIPEIRKKEQENAKTSILRELLKKGTVVMPGAFNAMSAMIIEQVGFNAVYITGAGLANGITGYPDIGLLTMTEVVQNARYIADAVKVPAICDADTGYGSPVNIMRTVSEFERAGIAGIHIEDQESPKRCGHLGGKRLIPPEDMVKKIAASVEARNDPDFLIIARTDARSVNGLDDAIERANCYLDAGADMIFPEALESEEEFSDFSRKVDCPLLANMTEFGRTPYISVEQFEAMGYNIVIFPMTAFRVMMKAVRDSMIELKETGSQKGFLSSMQTRDELYDLIHYADYEKMDNKIADFYKKGV